MNKYAVTIAASLAVLISVSQPAAAQTNLASLGTDNFALLDTLNATVAQSSTSLTNVAPISFGGLFAGAFVNVNTDWSAYGDSNIWTFGLYMRTPGDNPNLPFTVEFLKELPPVEPGDPVSYELINSYQGTTDSATSTSSFVAFSSLFQSGTDDFSEVSAMQMTWDGGATGNINVVIEGVGVVPEPSTWALLLCGGVLLGGLAWRRRCAAARR
jgi:hypothetical protein